MIFLPVWPLILDCLRPLDRKLANQSHKANVNLELEIERTLAWLRGREAKKGENRYRTYMEVYSLYSRRNVAARSYN